MMGVSFGIPSNSGRRFLIPRSASQFQDTDFPVKVVLKLCFLVFAFAEWVGETSARRGIQKCGMSVAWDSRGADAAGADEDWDWDWDGDGDGGADGEVCALDEEVVDAERVLVTCPHVSAPISAPRARLGARQ